MIVLAHFMASTSVEPSEYIALFDDDYEDISEYQQEDYDLYGIYEIHHSNHKSELAYLPYGQFKEW